MEVRTGLWRAQIPLRLGQGVYGSVAVFLIEPETSSMSAHQKAMTEASMRYASSASTTPPSLKRNRVVEPGIQHLSNSKRRLRPLAATGSHKHLPASPIPSLDRPLLASPLTSPSSPQVATSSAGSRRKKQTPRRSTAEDRPGWIMIDTGPAEYGSAIVESAKTVMQGSSSPCITRILLTHLHKHHIGALPTILKNWNQALTFCHPSARAALIAASATMSDFAKLGSKSSCLPGAKLVPLPRDTMLPTSSSATDTEDTYIIPDMVYALRDRENCGSSDQSGRQVVALFTPGHVEAHCSFVHQPSNSLLCGDVWKNKGTFNAGGGAMYDVKGSYRGNNISLLRDVDIVKEQGGRSKQLIASMLKLQQVSFSKMYPSHDNQRGVPSADIGKVMMQPRFTSARGRAVTPK